MHGKDLDLLFNPRSLAMIGASGTPGKWGYIILLNILKGNYKGKVFPVNPKSDAIFGIPCHKTITDIKDDIDLAVIATPASSVPGVIDSCGQKNIKNIIVITADFSESGPAGKQLEKEVVNKISKYGMRLVGPNTMGIFSARSSLHILMPTIIPSHGPVSMFSQSGNVGVQMLAYGKQQNVGFEKFVSSGNEADLSAIDYLNYFYSDKDTRVILGYIEGFEENSTFLQVAKTISKEKPIIVLKGGRTEAGSKAAASHTGSMAGSSRINKAIFRQAGITETASSQELIDCAKAFVNYPLPKGNRVGIITRGGGWGVLTSDACAENGLEVPPLSADLISKMDNLLPKYWSRGNPVDLVASIMNDPLPACLEMLANWDGVDSIICLGSGFSSFGFEYAKDLEGSKELLDTLKRISDLFQMRTQQADPVFKIIGQLVQSTGKPIVSVALGSEDMLGKNVDQYGIVSFPTPGRAVRVLKHMNQYRQFIDSQHS
ncbi:MAG: CoA-binding protein [Proteobacteria bacterium]|nr:CoA-binding protein [Pseudomonadota bacterium]